MTPPSIKDVARLAEVSIGTDSNVLRPTAMSCGNDLLALGALQGAIANDLKVPRDLALVGYDDIDFAAGTSVPLTTVAQPRHEIGRMALQLLEEEVAEGEEHVHRQVRYTPELVVRASSG